MHHTDPRGELRTDLEAREGVGEVELDEEGGRGRFEHPIVRRLEIANQARLVQGRVERGRGEARFDRMDVTDQLDGFGVARSTAVEVRRDPIAQARGLADVEQVTALVA